jgi:hypothetical protein
MCPYLKDETSIFKNSKAIRKKGFFIIERALLSLKTKKREKGLRLLAMMKSTKICLIA